MYRHPVAVVINQDAQTYHVKLNDGTQHMISANSFNHCPQPFTYDSSFKFDLHEVAFIKLNQGIGIKNIYTGEKLTVPYQPGLGLDMWSDKVSIISNSIYQLCEPSGCCETALGMELSSGLYIDFSF